jgi:hypothetical protein
MGEIHRHRWRIQTIRLRLLPRRLGHPSCNDMTVRHQMQAASAGKVVDADRLSPGGDTHSEQVQPRVVLDRLQHQHVRTSTSTSHPKSGGAEDVPVMRVCGAAASRPCTCVPADRPSLAAVGGLDDLDPVTPVSKTGPPSKIRRLPRAEGRMGVARRHPVLSSSKAMPMVSAENWE